MTLPREDPAGPSAPQAGLPATLGTLARPLRWLVAGVRILFLALGQVLLLAYLIVSRTLLAFLALYLVLYFLVGANPVRHQLEALISDALPGGITAASVQWGPLPWHLRIADGRVHGARGEDVIRARAVEATIDWGETVPRLADWILAPNTHPFGLRFERVDALEPWVLIEVDDDYNVGLVQAFTIAGWHPAGAPPADPAARPPTFDIQANLVRVIDGSGRVETPSFWVEARGLQTVASFLLSGEDHVTIDAKRTTITDATLGIYQMATTTGVPARVQVHDLVVENYAQRTRALRWARATGRLDHGSIVSTGWLDATPTPAIWSATLDAALDDGAHETRDFTGGAVAGPLDVHLRGGGTLSQLDLDVTATSPRATLGPLAVDDLTLHARILPRGTHANPMLHAIHLDTLDGRALGGHVALTDGAWESAAPDDPRGDARDLDVGFTLTNLDAAPALGAFMPLVPAVLADLLAGRYSARGRLALRYDPATAQTRTELDLFSAGVLLSNPPHPLLGRPITLSGQLATRQGPAAPADLAAAKGVPFVDELDLAQVVLDSGEDRLRLAGHLDLARQTLDLEPYLRLGDLRPLGDTVGLPGIAGRFVVKSMRATGTLTDPRIAGTINWTDAALDGHPLVQVTGRVELAGGRLDVSQLRSANPLGTFALDGQIRLFERGFHPDPQLPFVLRELQIDHLALGALDDLLGPAARIDLDAQNLAGHAAGGALAALSSLAGHALFTVHSAVIAGEPIESIVAHIDPAHDRINVEELLVTTPAGAQLRGDAIIYKTPGGIASTLAGGQLEGHLALSGLTLPALKAVQRLAPQLAGSVDARLVLGGTTRRPTFIGSVDLADVAWGEVALGDASLALQTLPATGPDPTSQLDISAHDNAFFTGFTLEAATLALDGLRPARLLATIRAKDLALERIIPAAKSDKLEVRLSGVADLDLPFGAGTPHLSLRAAPGDLRLNLPERAVGWVNTTELHLTEDAGRLQLDPLGLGPPSALTGAPTLAQGGLRACGALDPNGLDLQIAGAVELAFIPGISGAFSVAAGRLRITRDAALESAMADLHAAACFPDHPPIMRLSGPPSAPAIAGTFETEGVNLVPRGAGRELRFTEHSTVVVTSIPRGPASRANLRLTSPVGIGLRGELDDGTFAVSGELQLADFAPSRADLDLTGTDLFVQSPGVIALTASPHARIRARGLDTATPDIIVEGDLAISEGRFTKSFDTLAQAVGSAIGANTDAYSRSVLDDLPWLANVRLAVDIKADDFAIRTAVPLVRTDLSARLDLGLAGTLARPQLTRRIDLLPGGKLTYLIFERTFQVTQGALDFDGDPARPIVDLTAQSVITYLARASTSTQDEDEKDVTVILRITGRVPELKIELSADDPTFDQADIQSLLITGKPRSELDRAQESGVVSADLANVLNAVFASPFVKTASVGVGQAGSLEYRVGTCFAPNLCLDTTTVAADTETTIRAKLSFTLGDNLVCEGTLRRSDTATSANQKTYEARCRYRIPLE